METNFDVVIAGAGLAGLAAGATAAQAGRRVLVLDGQSPGGRARTDDRRGFLFNQGAHALYRKGHAERVLADLGIPTPPGGKPSTQVWGRRGGIVSVLPFRPADALRSRLMSTRSKAQLGRFTISLRFIEPEQLTAMSAESWLTGLGLTQDATDVLRVLGRVATYADDLEAISADAVASQLKGAILNGVRYIDGGWRVLVDALQAAAVAAGAEVRTGSAVLTVESADSDVVVMLADRTMLSAGAVVLATGGPAATASVLREPPRWGLVGPPSTAACLDLGLRRVPDHRVLFGIDEPLYLSTHSGSAAGLAPDGAEVVHLMRYGARDADTDRADLWRHARHAGITDADVIEQRFLARMVTNHAVPVPGAGLAGRPFIDSAGVAGVFIAGDWVGPDGMLADAALASGQAAGLAAAAYAETATAVPA